MDPFFVGIWGPNLRFGDQILRRVDQKKLKISRKSISKRNPWLTPPWWDRRLNRRSGRRFVGRAVAPAVAPAVEPPAR